MSRAKKASARARSEAGAVAVLTTTLVGLEGVIHGLAAGVRDNTARLEKRLMGLSERLDAAERREADRTFVKPEPNPMCDTSRLAASATVPPLEIGAVQAKSQVTEGGNYHRVTIRGDGLSSAKVGPIDAEAVDRLEKESRARDAEGVLEAASRMAYGSPGSLQIRDECAIDPGVIERLNKALNGEFSSYLPEAPSHPVLLVLSEVVKLRRHLEAQDRLVRFLVERSGGLR